MSLTLIATLGRSPGVVTGLYDALIEDTLHRPDRLVLLRTKHPDVQAAANLVHEELCNHTTPLPPWAIQDIPFDALDLRGGKRHVLAFQKIATDIMDNCIANGEKLILGVTGGRVSMGAMLAVNAQLYQDVIGMYHVWADAEIEENGDILSLQDLLRANRIDEYKAALHPPSEQRELVWLPVWHMQTAREYVQQRSTLELKNDHTFPIDAVRTVLSALPRRMTVEQAEKYLSIVEKIHNGDDPMQHFDMLIEVLQEAQVTDARKYIGDLFNYAGRDGDVDVMIQRWVDDMERSRLYWTLNLRRSYQEHREDLMVVLTVIQAGLALLSYHFQVGGF